VIFRTVGLIYCHQRKSFSKGFSKGLARSDTQAIPSVRLGEKRAQKRSQAVVTGDSTNR